MYWVFLWKAFCFQISFLCFAAKCKLFHSHFVKKCLNEIMNFSRDWTRTFESRNHFGTMAQGLVLQCLRVKHLKKDQRKAYENSADKCLKTHLLVLAHFFLLTKAAAFKRQNSIHTTALCEIPHFIFYTHEIDFPCDLSRSLSTYVYTQHR